MERKNKQRLSLTVEADTLTRLHAMRRRYGFPTVCQLCRVMLVLVLNTLERRKAEAATREREIEDMFDEYFDWEPQPNGDVPQRRWHRSVNDE